MSNMFINKLGKSFFTDISSAIPARLKIVDNNTFTLRCENNKLLTFILHEENQCIEVVYPELSTASKENPNITFKRKERKGILKPKFCFVWVNFITLTFGEYNHQQSLTTSLK